MALVVQPDALVLETTDYHGWEVSFLPVVTEVVDAMERISRPDGVSRIGLRYVDEIRVPAVKTTPGDWSGYIARHFLAVVDPGVIPTSLRPCSWQGFVQYQTGDESTLTVRFGPQDGYAVDPVGQTRRLNPVEPGPFFLLDSDSFWSAEAEIPQFDADWIRERCHVLHEPAREFFKIAVTDKLRREVFNRKEGNVS